MTSTQEPNTLALCSRKGTAKLIVPIYFGAKTSEFCYLFLITGVRGKFRFERNQINFDPARSTTMKSLPGALRALCNISSDDG